MAASQTTQKVRKILGVDLTRMIRAVLETLEAVLPVAAVAEAADVKRVFRSLFY